MRIARLLMLVLAFSASLGASGLSRADVSAHERQREQLTQAAVAGARRAGGIVPLLQLWAQAPQVDPRDTLARLERIAAAPGIDPPREVYIRTLLAQIRRVLGELDEASAQLRALGYLRDFLVVGPFDNEGKRGMARTLPAEAAAAGPFDREARYPGRLRPVGWRTLPSSDLEPGVRLDSSLRPSEEVCALLATTIEVDRARPITLWVGNGGAFRLFFNGEAVLEDEAYRRADPERHVALVGARPGPNRLLIKTCTATGPWGLALRVGDARGAPLPGLRASSASMPPISPSAGPSRLPRAPRSAFAALERDAARGSAAQLEALARFMELTGADDPAESRARQLAMRAAELEPSVSRLLLAESLAEHRTDRIRLSDRALALAPQDPSVRLLQARLALSGVHPPSALPILESFPAGTPEADEAAALHATLLLELGLPEAALALARRLLEASPRAHARVTLAAELARAAGRLDEAQQLRRRAVEIRYDDLRSRRMLIGDHVRRQEPELARPHLEAIHRLAGNDVPTLRFLASMEEALERDGEALERVQEALRIAPEDADTFALEGRILLRLHQPDAALRSLRSALELRPQDASIRELMEQIRPSERPDERYAVSSAELLARRGEANGFSRTTLEDLTVNTVFESGLGSSFRQVAIEVHDEEAARQLRTYAIQFDPGAQRVDLRLARLYRGGRRLEAVNVFEQQLGEPWYNIYYDTRALVVLFPALEPGDVIELRWRVDDISHRNLFADYYGDLRFLQEFHPIRRLDYVLLTPSSRDFHFNSPRLAGLVHEREESGGIRRDHFHVEDVPALRTEPGMPGLTEVAPYLHVSTYQSWEEVGRWYWGLIEDQLRPDEELRSTVRELVAGTTDLRERVRRIHNWVIRNTRYVGLEFGIHGYKPYRVTQIVRRGFGDCKDKASLMFAMFREAGIDAHLVLTRTRRNGTISDLPASLAIFDHAIAYVPALDLYLDGTAENSGTMELPGMDQGVTVLHVWPEGSELRTTPNLSADRNRRERTLVAALEADGAARLEVHETISGSEAPRYRSLYAAEGTRADRFEGSLRRLYPGASLDELSIGGLEQLEGAIELRYEARVPQLGSRDAGALSIGVSSLDGLMRQLAASTERRHPLDLGEPSIFLEERELRPPRGMRLGALPAGGEVESPFGRIRVQIEPRPPGVGVRVELRLDADRVEPADYPAFRAWLEQVERLLRERIRFEETPR